LQAKTGLVLRTFYRLQAGSYNQRRERQLLDPIFDRANAGRKKAQKAQKRNSLA
jgi:hypothetical protein